MNQIVANGQVFSNTVAAWLTQHPKRVAAVVTALLLTGGGGAFAVASLAPDAADLPVREVLEAVRPLALPEYNQDAAPAYVLYRTDVTRSSDTTSTLLKRLGVDDAEAAAFLRNDRTVQQILLGRSGRQVTAQALGDQRLSKLTARWSAETEGQFNRLVIERTPQGFVSHVESAPLMATSRLASGTIQTSLFAATDDAGLPDSIATQVAEIFSSEIDFRRALRKDDRFNVVYEVLEGDGEPLRTGRVLSAEFVNAGKTFQAMWFQPAGRDAQGATAKGSYYTLDGQSLRRAFLSSPVEFSRISSGFAMRFHPILKQNRPHLGTDFAASTGTPARTVGDGVVEFAGAQNGYGNVIFVKHRNNTETVYAHLSKIMVQRGQSVSQGQTIGLVGSTGWATGPHLHFEVRVNGIQHDPMAIAQKSETVPVSAAAMPQFKQVASNVRAELQAAATLNSTRFE
ncbi:MAG: M23 family metallopeptidase [Rhodoferax sp.]|uniref:M23 family metallopeptidase n=1 Tax=Rhodoferax sp. TaxID=50421 RepID=UPI0026183F1B|nr:M23 family metallopeptidase [Rhodoferax sp.]MDD2880150.1 M23 family metallopeptidase [Rhodoferax sp.]